MSSFELVIRISANDVHYGGNLVAGAYLMKLFGDAITGLSATLDNDEGLLSSWDKVRFLAPVYPGDFVKVRAQICEQTRLRRFVEVSAFRCIRSISSDTSDVELVVSEECVATAKGVFVVPYSKVKRTKKDLD
jgi:acyl-coenzyme A thioesterase PaaI-like protein